MNDIEIVEEADNPESIQLIVNDHLPKLIELLLDVEPRYRRRLVDAAFVLIS